MGISLARNISNDAVCTGPLPGNAFDSVAMARDEGDLGSPAKEFPDECKSEAGRPAGNGDAQPQQVFTRHVVFHVDF